MHNVQKIKQASRKWYLFLGGFLVVCYLVGCGGTGMSAPAVSNGPQSSRKSDISTSTTASDVKPSAEEADLYRKRGNLLFYLHMYKGLTIFSMENAKNPKILSNLPLYGYPVEMFVEEKVAYVMVRNVALPYQLAQTNRYRQHMDQTQLISVDIADLKNPKILNRFKTNQYLLPGYTRKVGSTIYMLTHSSLPSQSTTSRGLPGMSLHVIDVSKPSTMKQMRSISLRSGLGKETILASGSNVAVSPTLSDREVPFRENSEEAMSDKLLLRSLIPVRHISSVLTATSSRLIVTSNLVYQAEMIIKASPFNGGSSTSSRGPRFGGFSNCSANERRNFPSNPIQQFNPELNYARVQVFDITNGMVQKHSFLVQGHMSDQFKQNVVKDGTKEDALYLGIVRRNALQITPTRITSTVKNLLISIDLTKSQPTVRNMLAFGKPNESIRGSLFDTSRQVVYAITATGEDQQAGATNRINTERNRPRENLLLRDPLYALSYKNPDKLQSLSDIDELSGDINLFRLIEGGKFLLAVGRDNSSACTGFDKDAGVFSRTAVSIIDVRNLSKIKLVQRRCVRVNPSVQVTSSSINWDRDQAHKYIGLHQSDNLNVVAVPVRFQENTNQKEQTAIGLIQWDISRYKENLPNTSQNVLTNLGTLEHSKRHGSLQRILFFQNTSTPKAPVLVTLAEEAVNVASLDDLRKPSPLLSIPMSQHTKGVYQMGEYLVTQRAPSLTGLREASPEYTQQTMTRIFSVYGIGSNTTGPPLSQVTIQKVTHVVAWNNYLLVSQLLSPLQTGITVVDFSNPKSPKVVQTPIKSSSFLLSQKFSIQRQSNIYRKQWLKTEQGIVLLRVNNNQMELGLLNMTKPTAPTWETMAELSDNQKNYHLLDVEKGKFVLASSLRDDSWLQHWSWNGNKWQSEQKLDFPQTYCLKIYRMGTENLYLGDSGSPFHHKNIVLYKRTENNWTPVSRIDTGSTLNLLTHDNYLTTYDKKKLKVYRVQKDLSLKLLVTTDLTYQWLGPEDGTKSLKLEHAHGSYLQLSTPKNGGIFWLKIEESTALTEVKPLFYAPNFTWKLSDQGTGVIQTQTVNTNHILLHNNKAYIASGPFGVQAFDLKRSSIPRR